MWKFLYNIITEPLGLPIDPVLEYIILLIIGEIVHEIAFFISSGGAFGGIIYWGTKLLSFLIIRGIVYGIVIAINFIIVNWIWFAIGLAILLMGIIAVRKLLRI